MSKGDKTRVLYLFGAVIILKNTMKKVTTGICVLGTAVLINQALLAPNVLTVKAAQAEIALSVGSATVLGSDRDAEASKTEAESVTTAEAVDTTETE